MKTKAELIAFLKTFKVTKNQGKIMTEVIQVITELWDEKTMTMLLQQIKNWLQNLTNQHQDLYTNQRSLQITMRKWEELAKLKGWITQEDLVEAGNVVSEVIKKELAAAKAAKNNTDEPTDTCDGESEKCCGSEDCECDDGDV